MDTVLLIAEFLRLTPSERTDFVESYKISMDGFENYYRRKNILELFENFRKYSEIYTAPDHQPLVSYHDISDMSTVSGQNEINHLLFHILFLETRKSDPQIRLLIQPDTDFLMNLLPTLGYENQNLSITQIICFHKSDELTNDKKDYNLACLKKILPVTALRADIICLLLLWGSDSFIGRSPFVSLPCTDVRARSSPLQRHAIRYCL